MYNHFTIFIINLDALSKYKNLNQNLPTAVLIYRDGFKYYNDGSFEAYMSEINLMQVSSVLNFLPYVLYRMLCHCNQRFLVIMDR